MNVSSSTPDTSKRLVVEETLERAVGALLDAQHPDGWWKGELESNVSIEAEDLLLRKFIGILDKQTLEETAAWIRCRQRSDGTWTHYYDGPPNLSVSIEAYAALRLAGDDPAAEHMRSAREFILSAGGLESSRVFTRIWLALFGQWRWQDLPSLPPEVIFLPKSFPLNVYDFACWARQTIVSLTIVSTLRPSAPLGFDLGELRTGRLPPERRSESGECSARFFTALDAFLHRCHRRWPHALREAALGRAERWILDRQEADGCWGGIQPPWAYSILALYLRGYSLEHPVLARALAGIDNFTIRENGMRRLECCQSPIWDTALAVVALRDAGLSSDHPALVAAADWLVSKEVRVSGDWSVRRQDLPPGGWAFEFHNDNYPDLDDTAEVVLALRRVSPPDRRRVDAAVERAVTWVEGMQCSDGGYAAFDVDNVRSLCGELPFCDFGEVIDPPSADVTAHVVEMLAAVAGDVPVDSLRLRRAVDWLWKAQEVNGSWFGRWGANHIYGTGAVLPALAAAGVSPGDERIRRAVRWLEGCQDADGGWGEDLRSYEEEAWQGRGAPTASQTSWALLALLSAGEVSEPTRRGIDWLVRNCRSDGTWDEPQFTGTGFPGDFYLNYHLYRQVFPVMALGRYLRSGAVVPRAAAEVRPLGANAVAAALDAFPSVESSSEGGVAGDAAVAASGEA